ncbi:ATP-binding cassette domain-containing protein [Agrococcus sp. SGAir0287]|uniref:ATP-binding cassette domain-containing protein n=1 Tax=Agrococcus sp. SGAir0287 TaxID=2070347 RepID=UPI0015869FB2|nr:ABC transporter ATP-binding protein [Agrococcus sp. SGAir0287]
MHKLDVTDLRIAIGGRTIVDRISFSVAPGQRVCLLGESGSGKSLTAGAVIGRLPSHAVVDGSITVGGTEVLGVAASRRPDHARVATVFQDSAVALNPLVRIKDQLVEPLRRHRGLTRKEATQAAIDLAESVGLPDPARTVELFSAELSGGQRQRVCIALALACDTGLLVADEPTTALDVVTQKRVLDVLQTYTAGERTPSLLFITHDFGVAAELCTDAVVMRSGEVVEQGPLSTLFTAPRHEYTRSLVAAARAATLEPATARLREEPAVAAEPERATFLDVQGVGKTYVVPGRRLFSSPEERVALEPTSLTIEAGERVGIVGVSGSGKTTLLRLMLAIESATTGEIRCEGTDVRPGPVRSLAWYRRKVQYVPQDPASTLDPLMTVEALLQEPLVRLRVPGDHAAMAAEALESVGLDEGYRRRRVHELSGGQAQRVAIARAIATHPDLLLADEPVSGLDLPMRESIVGLLQEISRTRGTGIVVVSHDLSMVASLCERTIVMHGGAVIEDQPTLQVLTAPQHERTRDLLASIPSLDRATPQLVGAE